MLNFCFVTVAVFLMACLIRFINEFFFQLSAYNNLTEENSEKLKAGVELLK